MSAPHTNGVPTHTEQQSDGSFSTDAQDSATSVTMIDANANGMHTGIKRQSDSLFVSEHEPSPSEDVKDTKRPRLSITSDDKSSLTSGYHYTLETLAENGCVPAYNANQEPTPRIAAYCTSFGLAEAAITAACRDVLTAYESVKMRSGYTNEAVENVCEELKKLGRPSTYYPDIKPIACLGSAGIGKSSTINSILSQKSVAPELDSDERGTYVVHEYAGMHPEQVHPYLIEVLFRAPGVIQQLISRHYRNVVRALRQDDELSDGEDDDLREKMETALEFFHHLFCNQPGFGDLDETKDYFEARMDMEDNEVLADLEACFEIFKHSRPNQLAGSQESYRVHTEDELCSMFSAITRPIKPRGSEAPTPSPWPVISKVRVRQLQVPFLNNSGLVLADTAGVNDTNLTVVENTQRYLESAGAILVFAGMSRVTKDTTLDRYLRDCIQLGKMKSTYVVITKIDEKKLFTPLEQKTLDQQDQKRVEEAEAEVARVELQIKETERQKDNEQNNEQFRTLDQDLRRLNLQSIKAKAGLKQLTIEIHCGNIQAKLKDRLRKLSKDENAPDLQTLFVSNAEYQRHLAGYDKKNPPQLDLEGTGIPAVRRLLYEISASGKFETLQGFSTTLPRKFDGIYSILTRSTLERKEEVLRVIECQIEKDFTPLASTYTEAIQECFHEHIILTIKANERKWIDKGSALVAKWEKSMKSSTFSAFCRRSGVWRVPQPKGHKSEAKEMSWNNLIREISDEKLLIAFSNLEEALESEEIAFKDRMLHIYNNLKLAVKGCKGAQGMGTPMDDYLDAVKGIIDTATEKLDDQLRAISDMIRHIRYLATVDSSDLHGFVTEAMQETYEICTGLANLKFESKQQLKGGSKKKGTGPHARRIECIRNKVTGTGEDNCSVFVAVGREAEKKLREHLVTKWQAKSDAIVQECRQSILANFKGRFRDNETESEDNPVVTKMLQDALRKADAAIKGPLSMYLQECEDFEKRGN